MGAGLVTKNLVRGKNWSGGPLFACKNWTPRAKFGPRRELEEIWPQSVGVFRKVSSAGSYLASVAKLLDEGVAISLHGFVCSYRLANLPAD